MIDPEVVAAMRRIIPRWAPPVYMLPVKWMQKGSNKATSPLPTRQVGAVRDLSIEGPGGALPLRTYQPVGEKGPRPLVVFIHGGGWVLCGLESHDEICRNLCVEMDCVVVSVDYRLAPQYRFPAGADDCLAATRWAASHAGELGADATRIALVGDSAGGTLTIATALRCAAEGGPALRAIAPLYPAADLRAPSTHASRREFGTRKSFGITPREMAWYTRSYLRNAGDALHPWVSPLLAPDLGSLPPCLLVTAEVDALRDEGAALARAIAAAGVKVDYRCFAALPHGFMSFAAAPVARRAIGEVTAALAKLLEPSRP